MHKDTRAMRLSDVTCISMTHWHFKDSILHNGPMVLHMSRLEMPVHESALEIAL